jgi:hypothetical protein
VYIFSDNRQTLENIVNKTGNKWYSHLLSKMHKRIQKNLYKKTLTYYYKSGIMYTVNERGGNVRYKTLTPTARTSQTVHKTNTKNTLTKGSECGIINTEQEKRKQQNEIK